MIDICFWLTIALFSTHELDAIRRHEWRIFPVVGQLPEVFAKELFIWLHVPVFYAIYWVASNGANSVIAIAFSIFSVIHVFLHWVFKPHPKNEFCGFSSWAMIILTGTFGVLHIVAYLFYG